MDDGWNRAGDKLRADIEKDHELPEEENMTDDNVVPLTPELVSMLAQPQTEFEPQDVPIRIKLKSNVRKFVVPDIRSWGYVREGIFAIGHWDTDAESERTVLIFPDEVSYIEYDFDALEKALEPDEAGEEDVA